MTHALAASALFVLLLLLIGYAALALLVRRRDLNIFATLGFAWILGALTAAGTGEVLLLTGHLDAVVPVTWILAVLAAATVTVRVVRRQPLPGTLPSRSDLVVLAVLGAVFALLALAAALGPLIAWDAVVIWLGKAKSFFYEPGLPNAFFRNPNFTLANLAYPVGLPLLIASAYRFAGQVLEPAATLPLGTFWYATVLLLVGVVRQLSARPRPWQALLLVLIVVPVGQFLAFYANGYADVAMAACVAAAAAAALLAAQAGRLNESWPYLLLTWLAAVLAALTKNEGLSFAAIASLLLAAYVLVRVSPRTLLALARRRAARTTLAVVGVLAVVAPVVAWVWTAQHLGYSSGLADSSAPLQGAGMSLLERLLTVLRYGMRSVTTVTLWLWFLVPTVLAFAVTWWHVLRYRRSYPGWWLAGSLVVLQAGAYLVVYLLSNYEITWYLETTFERLTLHLAPALAITAVGYWLARRRGRAGATSGGT
ncbi:MAG: hypothetical protein U0514_00445 [Candidatus Andersenbacteria bacterium]